MSSGARCLRGDQSIGARCPGGEVSKLQGGDMSTGAKCLVTHKTTTKYPSCLLRPPVVF